MDRELESILGIARDKVRELRRANELLTARVETFEMCAMMVAARLPERGGMGAEEDIAWRIDRYIQAQKEGPAKPRAAKPADDEG